MSEQLPRLEDDNRREQLEQNLRAEFEFFDIMDEGIARDPGIDDEALKCIASILLRKERPMSNILRAQQQRMYMARKQRLEGEQ